MPDGILQELNVDLAELVEPQMAKAWKEMRSEDRFLRDDAARLLAVGLRILANESSGERLQRRDLLLQVVRPALNQLHLALLRPSAGERERLHGSLLSLSVLLPVWE